MSQDTRFTRRPRRDHLFLVEGDVALRDMLCCYLEEQGVACTPMASAEEMLHRIHRVRPDLIVLNAHLPRMSGLDACRRLRAKGDKVPIIFLTPRDEEIDRLLGLEMGADDCLSKPFSARELLARVRAVLRRTAFTPGAPLATSAAVRIGECVFQVGQRSLYCGDDVRVLGTIEYAMLAELTTNAGVPISRERLVAVSHGRGLPVSLRAVDATMVRLRRAVEPEPAMPRYIQTVRKHGYVFVPDGSCPKPA